jgi:hypothetical protein
VTHPHEIARHYVCGMCNPPARAGKGKLSGSLSTSIAVEAKTPAVVQDGVDEELYADVSGDDELHTILRAEADLHADVAPVDLLVAKAANKRAAKTRGTSA